MSSKRRQKFRLNRARRFHTTTASSTLEVLPVDQEHGLSLVPAWTHAFVDRLIELSQRPEGWDSYGARAMQVAVVENVVSFLASFSHAIQSDPAVSLTSEGGLFLSWQNAAGVVEVSMEPDADVYVSYEDSLRGVEWEGPASEATLLEKWLWQTSSPTYR